MNKLVIIVALLFVLIGVFVPQDFINTGTPSPLNIFGTPLTQNTVYSTALTPASYGTPPVGNAKVSILALDTYTENGYPIIYSTFSGQTSASTFFTLSGSFELCNTGNGGSGKSSNVLVADTTYQLKGTWSYYIIEGGSEVQYTSGSYTMSPVTPTSNNAVYNFILSGNNYFQGAQTGIVQMNFKFDICAVQDTNVALVGNSFNNICGQTIYEQAYIGQASGSISAPSPVQDGQTFGITYSTGYGQSYSTSNTAPYYSIYVYGSQAYNGGHIVKTYNVNPMTTSEVYFTMPQNAWSYSTNPTANIWTIKLTNSIFVSDVQQTISVKSLTLVPPPPSITVTNSPPNGQYLVGDTVNVLIHTTPNSITHSGITSAVVWVYTGLMPNAPSDYILTEVTVPIINGNGTFSFEIPDTSQNVYIKAYSFDQSGESSSYTIYEIGSNHIHPTNQSLQLNYIYIVVFVVIAIASSILMFLFVPVDLISKAVLFAGWIPMWILLFNGFFPGFL